MNLARSPFINEIDLTGVSGATGSKIELFLWNTGSQPANPQYTLDKLLPASNNAKMYYNIAPYVREYFTFTSWQNLYNVYDQDISTNFKVNYAIKRYKLVSGTYTLLSTITGDFMDGYAEYYGYNASITSTVFLNEGTYIYHYDSSVANSAPQNMAGTFDVDLEAADAIRYTNLRTGATHTVTASAGGIKTFVRVYENYLADGNKVEFLGGGSAVRWTGKFVNECEPKYSPVQIDFINKYGSWARVFFMKANSRQVTAQTSRFKHNPATLPSTENAGQISEFNTTGTETIKLNTGWVNDGYAEYLEELILSEKVMLLDFGYTGAYAYKPVTVKTKNLDKQKAINTGMINYTIEFEFSFDIIQNVL